MRPADQGASSSTADRSPNCSEQGSATTQSSVHSSGEECRRSFVMVRRLNAAEAHLRSRRPTRTSLVHFVLVLIASWGVISTTAVAIFILSRDADPDHRAIIRMTIGLILIWCVLGGLAMYRFRDGFVAWATRIPLGWRTQFVLLCIVFAMLEEAVTTSLTNMATLGGVTDAARITASKNYLEVVLKHSVIAFVPLFLCWGWLLSRYDFRPIEVLLLFGLNGTLAETITFGPQNLIQVRMWVWVYGLMAYLPACTVPEERGASIVRGWHWLMAVFLPLVFIIPLALWLLWRAVAVSWRWLTRKPGFSTDMGGDQDEVRP